MRATISRDTPSRCARWRPGARCSRAIAAPTTRPAAGCGSWTWSPPQARRSGCLSPRPPRSSGRLRRILLIDDTPEIAELLTFALRDRGYDVFATGYTSTVNELVVEQRADALVLDCSVYNMSESLFDTVRDDPNQVHSAVSSIIPRDTK